MRPGSISAAAKRMPIWANAVAAANILMRTHGEKACRGRGWPGIRVTQPTENWHKRDNATLELMAKRIRCANYGITTSQIAVDGVNGGNIQAGSITNAKVLENDIRPNKLYVSVAGLGISTNPIRCVDVNVDT